jgi:hypothetical protein
MSTFRFRRILLFSTMFCLTALASGQTWSGLTHQPTFYAGTALLLTDGTVLVQAMTSSHFGTGQWWRLTPDNTGSYVNGTWTQAASMPAGYAPLYYASAVLPDGRAIVEGGEDNNSSMVWTTLGAIYNPTTNAWTSVTPPAGWTTIGDAPSVVLAGGTFMLGDCCSANDALLDASSLTWSLTGGNTLRNNENGWGLLPSGHALSVNAFSPPSYGIYDPVAGTWSVLNNIPQLSINCEVGPAVLRPDGTVFAIGDNGNTATYNTTAGTWSAGPTLPSGLVVADGPAALLPDGNVLLDSSPKPSGNCASLTYSNGSKFYEFNGTSLTLVPAPPNAGNDPSFVGRMLVLPTGQILFTDQSKSVEIYTARGTFQSVWQPTISSLAATLYVGSPNNLIQGTQFNGLSQGAMYGDDAQMATNYPLVRITDNSTGHVLYVRTHNHSTMAVATGSATVSTNFDMPPSINTGAAELVVVANGIPSNPVNVTVASSCNVVHSCVLHPSIVISQDTITCTYPTLISTSTQVCVPTVNGQQCGPWVNGASGVLTSSSASASHPPGTINGPPNVCNYIDDVAGQVSQTQLFAH